MVAAASSSLRSRGKYQTALGSIELKLIPGNEARWSTKSRVFLSGKRSVEEVSAVVYERNHSYSRLRALGLLKPLTARA